MVDRRRDYAVRSAVDRIESPSSSSGGTPSSERLSDSGLSLPAPSEPDDTLGSIIANPADGDICLHDVYQRTLDEVVTLTGSVKGFIAERWPRPDGGSDLIVVAMRETLTRESSADLLPLNISKEFNAVITDNHYSPKILEQGELAQINFDSLRWKCPQEAMAIPLVDRENHFGMLFIVDPETHYNTSIVKRLWPLLTTCYRVKRALFANRAPNRAADTHESDSPEEKLNGLERISFDAIIGINDNHRVIHFNPSAEALFGVDEASALGQEIVEFLPERFPNEHRIHTFPSVPVYESLHRAEKSFYAQRDDGKPFPVDVRSCAYKNNGRTYFNLVIQDKSEQHAYRRDHEEQMQRFKAVSDLAPIGILQTNVVWECVYANDRWCEICGLKEPDVKGLHWINSIYRDDVESMLEALKDAMSERQELDFECRFQTPMGNIVWVEFRARPLFNDAGEVEGFLSTISDMTYRHIIEEKLRNMAERDSLTGLANRALFMGRLDHAIERLGRHGSLLLLCLDLDGFKTINDSLGHDVGDKLLIEVASRLKRCVRNEDTVARVGGDEFFVLIEDVADAVLASDVATKILASFAAPMMLDHQEIYITTSIGITYASSEVSADALSLIKQADIAMYRAKESGRNNYQYYSPEMEAESQDRLYLSNCLHKALERSEFQVHYQLQANIADETLMGSEALIRWQHPQRGLLPPKEFVSLLEETGLIGPVSEWLIREALMTHKKWISIGLMPRQSTISINLAPRQLRESSIVDVFESALYDNQLDGSNVVVEITESALMDQSKATFNVLERLKELGMKIAMDDFGTGYSSLTYLKRFPIDYIKIDQSFVRDILTDKGDEAITKAVIALAHSLGLNVVAEGVDSAEKLALLKEWGCHSYQGFLLHRPNCSSQVQSKIEGKSPPSDQATVCKL